MRGEGRGDAAPIVGPVVGKHLFAGASQAVQTRGSAQEIARRLDQGFAFVPGDHIRMGAQHPLEQGRARAREADQEDVSGGG